MVQLIFRWTAVLSVAACLSAVSATDLQAEDSLSALLDELTDSAQKSRERFGTYPAIDPALPARHRQIESEQVLTALGRRLNPDPTLDGYLKHQLLGFSPDFANASPQKLHAIVVNLPPLTGYPQPNQRQRMLLEIAETEVLPLRLIRSHIQPLIDNFHHAKARRAEANRHTVLYHKKIIHRMPAENGLQLLGRLVHAYHRYTSGWWVAGSKRYTPTRRLAEEAQGLWNRRRRVPAAIRKQMIRLLRAMHADQPDRNAIHPIQEMKMKDDGRLEILRKPRCFPINNKLYEDMLRYVSGPRR